MTLAHKIIIAVAAVMTMLTALSIGILALLFYPTYARLDEDMANRAYARVLETLAAESDGLAMSLRDWSVWDETYAFAGNTGNGYPAKNLTSEQYKNLTIDSFTILDPKGKVLFSQGPVPQAVLASGIDIRRTLPRFDTRVIKGPMVAWGQVGGVLAMMGTAPIAPSTGKAPSRGYLLFLRQMTPGRLQALGKRAGVEFRLRPLADADPIRDQRTTPGGEAITGRVILRGPGGQARFALEFDTPRHFSALGGETIRNTSIILGLASLLLCAGGAFFIIRLVARPLGRVARQMETIAACGSLEQRLNMTRRDEIGIVARGLDAMVADLKEAREKLEAQTYQSGMADLAAGVLHNVRNVLAPIFTSLWSAEQLLKEARSQRLFQALAALRDEATPTERRAKLLAYVEASLRDMAGKGDEALAECGNVRALAEQIEMILKDHDKVSHAERPMQAVSLAGVVEDALRQVAWHEHPGVTVVKHASLDNIMVTAQRVILLQVVGNILKNAMEAIERAPGREGRIDIAWAKYPPGQGALRIADTGIGIAAEQKANLFARGYSTSTDRKGGIGLHWCANALRAMGGAIRIESEGLHKGAVAIISLPCAIKEIAA